MSNFKLTWEADGLIEGYNVYRSTVPFAKDSLPAPIASGLIDKEYIDNSLAEKTKYYYRVSSYISSNEKVSDMIFLGDEFYNDVVLYARFNGSADDLSPKDNIPSLGNSVTYGTEGAKFNQALYVFANKNQCVTYPAENFGFNQGQDFTIEFWTYCTEKPTGFFYSPIGSWGANIGWCIFFTPSGINFSFDSYGIFTTVDYSVNTLYSIAITRKDGFVRLFLNGNIIGSVNNNSLISSSNLVVGGNGTNTDFWRGFVDEVRITKNVARYTSNYTPQNREFYDF